MNIVEKEAIEYASIGLFKDSYNFDVELLSKRLTSKLYSYKRSIDKLSFLNTLRKEVHDLKINHEEECEIKNCRTSRMYDTGLFVIDQDIESTSQNYDYSPVSNDEFSSEEKSELYCELNQIKDKLIKLGYGQEIIFNEIDDLKNLLNLGKKNWSQLLKGKLFDLATDKILEETVINEIYKTLMENFEDFAPFLKIK